MSVGEPGAALLLTIICDAGASISGATAVCVGSVGRTVSVRAMVASSMSELGRAGEGISVGTGMSVGDPVSALLLIIICDAEAKGGGALIVGTSSVPV